MTTAADIDVWKLWVSIAAAIVAAIGLVVTYFTFQASVDRERIDRTLALIAVADKPHVEQPRSAFQSFLIKLARTQSRLGTTEDKTQIARLMLSGYRRQDKFGQSQDAWSMVRPLGDYYQRVLACIESQACDKDIYCATVSRELITYARMTQAFRKSDAKLQSIFAATLDEEADKNRCN